MKDYKIDGSIIRVELDNGKKYNISKKWVENTMSNLDIDIEETILMWLTDNDKLIDEEQEELDKKAKGKVKLVASEEKTKKKTQKERVQKENPEKEYIIGCLAEYLEEINATNIVIENKLKLITFTYNNKEFKIDLIQKRQKKE